MKTSLLSTALFLFVVALPAGAQVQSQETLNKAHETVIDGKWEAKLATQDKPIAVFEFKNAAGIVSGTMTQEGKPTEIKNGSLDATKLKFETTQAPAGGGDSLTMAWTGIIKADGESMQLTSTPVMDLAKNDGRVRPQQMEARRIK